MNLSIIKSFLAALIACTCFSSGAQAGIIKKTVNSEGMGASLNLAIYDALDEAVGRINGKSIETRKQLDSVEVSKVQNESEAYYSSEAIQQNIKTATKGVVDGYEILSKSKSENGLWNVSLSVTVVKFQTRDSNRKRIAVFPLRVGGGRFEVKGEPIQPERIGCIVTQNLVTTLVQSRRFTVLDREYIAETVGEQAIALSPNSPVSEMARLGQEMVADYIMAGTLEGLSYAESKVRMQSSGRELTSRQGHVEMSIRLIDVSTREVVFSDFLKLVLGDKDLERFGASLRDDGPDSSLAIVAADRAGRRILDTIYPILVLAVSGDVVTLGQGGSQIKEGERLEVFMYGQPLTDPYTKEFIGREEISAGLVEVTRVNPKLTQARLVNSAMDIGKAFEPKKFICRAVVETPADKQALLKERKEQKEQRRKEKDQDW
jgi:TolB-like protein